MRTKFIVKYSVYWEQTSTCLNLEGTDPLYRKGDLAYREKFFYLGKRVDECLDWFDGWMKQYSDPIYPQEAKYYVINEILREENIPDDYACGYCYGLCGGDLVLTQIISERHFSFWNPKNGKHFTIMLEKPRCFIDRYEGYPRHYGKGMENIKIGDIVEYTEDRCSMISGGCGFYNPTGKNNLDLAKKWYKNSTELITRRLKHIDIFLHRGKLIIS